MNRRSFFTKLGLAAASLAILPAATTYARNWVAPSAKQKLWVPNPDWFKAEYEVFLIDQEPVFDKCFLQDTYEPLVRYRIANGILEPVMPWKQE